MLHKVGRTENLCEVVHGVRILRESGFLTDIYHNIGRGKSVKDDQFEQALQRCLEALDGLPEPKREELKKLVEQTRRRHEQIKQSLQSALSALDDWRLAQKYRLFDQEAHRREDGNKPDSPGPHSDP